jgi:riboflavin transporter FmnP
MSESGLFILPNSTQWFMDGTFSSLPKLFAQVIMNPSQAFLLLFSKIFSRK